MRVPIDGDEQFLIILEVPSSSVLADCGIIITWYAWASMRVVGGACCFSVRFMGAKWVARLHTMHPHRTGAAQGQHRLKRQEHRPTHEYGNCWRLD